MMPTPDPRLLEVEGRSWAVRVVGQTRTGFPPDAGAILLCLRFESSGESPREGLAVARILDDLDDEALEACLTQARPVTPPR